MQNSSLCHLQKCKMYYKMVTVKADYKKEIGNMRGNGISQWEYVYFSSTAHDFQICNERNWKLYRSIDEDEYETLDKCADFWIQNKSHAAFVHFFIEKGIFPNELFTDYLDNYIREFQDKYKCENIHWTKLHIMKKEHWLSPDVESDKLMDQKYCYKNDYVSRLCKKRYVCTNKFREKSEKQTYSVPEREIIVQLGIYFNLDSKSVDLLFSAAGLPKFYVVDVVDVISMYYLDRYHKEGINVPDKWEEEGRRRIREVKDSINRILKIMLDGSDDITGKAKTKMYSVNTAGSCRKIVYQHSLCDTVDEEIQKFMELETNEKNQRVEGNTFYITKRMEELYEKNKETDFNQMKDAMILQKDIDQNYMLALEYRYGYIRKVKEVLKKSLEKGNYIKNFEDTDWNFDVDEPWDYRRLAVKESEIQEKSKSDFRVSKAKLVKIWYCEDFITGGPKNRKVTSSTYCIDNYIRHRTVNLKTKTEKSDTEKKTEKVKIPQTMSKCALTKFVISMGIETQRDIYFESVGYGIERKPYKKYENNLKCENKSRDNSYPVDRSDMLFEYVCILRDKLIENYIRKNEKNNKEDSNILRNNLNKSFPFAKMMNYITRDIQYVLGFIIHKKESKIGKERELMVQEDRLMNPKNSGYCLCFPYSFALETHMLDDGDEDSEYLKILKIEKKS